MKELTKRNLEAIQNALRSNEEKFLDMNDKILSMQRTINSLNQEVQQLKKMSILNHTMSKGTGPTRK
jgi:hypothetical protein